MEKVELKMTKSVKAELRNEVSVYVPRPSHSLHRCLTQSILTSHVAQLDAGGLIS